MLGHIYIQSSYPMYFTPSSDSQIQHWYPKIMCIAIYSFIGKQLIKTNSDNSTPKKCSINFKSVCSLVTMPLGMYCGLWEMCRVKQWALRIWGAEKIHFRCYLLWIRSPFVAVVPSWYISGTQLSDNYLRKEPSSCTPRPRYC